MDLFRNTIRQFHPNQQFESGDVILEVQLNPFELNSWNRYSYVPNSLISSNIRYLNIFHFVIYAYDVCLHGEATLYIITISAFSNILIISCQPSAFFMSEIHKD